jgi:autotransporter-associated beta strand protein
MTRRLNLTRLESRLAPAIATWDGGGANPFWTTPANWVGDVGPNPGDDLHFPNGAAQRTNVNDFADGTAVGQIHITGANYVLSGNRVNLGGGILIEIPGQLGIPPVTQIAIPLTLTDHQMIKGDFNSPFSISTAIELNSFSLQIDVQAFSAASTVSGVISGLGAVTKTSSGVLELSAANTFPQTFFIDGGTVQVTGSLLSPVFIFNNSLLLGSGTVGTVSANNGRIEPRLLNSDFTQASPTTLTLGSLDPSDNLHLSFQITDTARSRLDVRGSVFLGGTLFIASHFSQHPFHVAEQIVIISNDNTDAVVGTFRNAPEGTIVSLGPIPLRITYRGGDGNDVAVIADSFAPAFAVGAAAGGFPLVNFYNAEGGRIRTILAYEASFRGGVRVVTTDMSGDGIPDVITAPGVGGGPVIRIWDGDDGHLMREFNAYDPAFRGGVWIAASRINNDGRDDIITGAGPGGGPHVRVFDGITDAPISSFFAFDANFRGGVSVAGTDGISIHFSFIPGSVVAGAGAGGVPVVRTFDGLTGDPRTAFFAYDPAFRGGVNVATGNLVGVDDIATAPMSNGGPHVRVFASHQNGTIQPGQPLAEFFAYDASFFGGVNIGIRPLGFNHPDTLITGAGAGGGPHVETWSFLTSTPTRELNLFAFDPSFTGGIFVG